MKSLFSVIAILLASNAAFAGGTLTGNPSGPIAGDMELPYLGDAHFSYQCSAILTATATGRRIQEIFTLSNDSETSFRIDPAKTGVQLSSAEKALFTGHGFRVDYIPTEDGGAELILTAVLNLSQDGRTFQAIGTTNATLDSARFEAQADYRTDSQGLSLNVLCAR